MPYKIDLYAVFIFLGIVQGIFLSLFFFTGKNRKIKANVFHGILILSLTLCTIEIFLMYTGYIINCLFLVDFSEPVAFIIGPSLYLMILSITRPEFSRWQYLHFAFAVIYLILVIPYYLLPDEVKFNSWVESYQLSVPMKDFECDDARVFWVTDHATLMIIISLVIYAIISLIEVVKVFIQKKDSFLYPSQQVLSRLRAGTVQLVVATILILIVKYFNPNDTGDHLVAVFISFVIYFTSFSVMRSSGFFRQTALEESEKQKAPFLPDDQQKRMLERLRGIMTNDKPFLNADFSLPILARLVGTSVHSLSQVINSGLGKSFSEMTAEYRVEEAKILLKKKINIKVEEIAEQVGYNSKSSFNNAFKKITGKTPSEFRGQAD